MDSKNTQPRAANETDRRITQIILVASAMACLLILWLVYGRAVDRSDVPAWVFTLPHLNAMFNLSATVLLVWGVRLIKRQNVNAHRMAMMGAFAASSCFLVSYLLYYALHGNVPFQGTGAVRPIYFFILITHIVLSVINLPMVLLTFVAALRGQYRRHRRLARWTYPMWLYVSVTGVIVYLMLQYFGARSGL